MKDVLEKVKSDFDLVLHSSDSFAGLAALRTKYAGKSGKIKEFFALAKASPNSKECFALVNELSCHINNSCKERQKQLQNLELQKKIDAEYIDVTYPARPAEIGAEHLISSSVRSLKNIFASMGFCHVDGPEIEDEWHVFDALNTPKHHPARQNQDSFYLKNGMMLRTHTSSVQIRFMQRSRPPLRICSVGRVYRNDWDATHTPMFHQMEALCVEEGMNMSCMRSCIEFFLKEFFDSGIEFRMRPSYFPFTEPSAEIDIKTNNSDWLEVLGCGMVHPNVLKNVGIDSKKYSGFALGVGVERITMLKHNIKDIRNFFNCDLRWKVV